MISVSPKQHIRTLGIIPARGGSKSIPKKNLALLLGKPLIFYAIRSAEDAKKLDAFIVSTDDQEIADLARSFGADVPFLRPAEYARDDSPDIEFMRHALGWVKENRGWEPEVIVNLRPTGPMRTGQDIDCVIETLFNTGCDSVRTVSLPLHSPFKMWSRDEKSARLRPLVPTEHFATLGTDVPRQLLPQNIYWQNGLVDATRARFIAEGAVYGPDIRGVITDPQRSLDIDDIEDLKAAEEIMKKKNL